MEFRVMVGKRVKMHRTHQRYSVQAAAREAKISRDTWVKIEAGEPVQDVKLQAALDLLGLDETGDRADHRLDPEGSVGGDAQDDGQFVESSTGRLVESGVTNADLYREILRSRAESDQHRAQTREEIQELTRRVERIEQQGS